MSAKQVNVADKTMSYTRYERARIVGARALQISMGAPVLIKDVKSVEPIEVALAELERGLIPITVKRTNKSYRREAESSESSG
ncbi:DNA-directed RNA polymerase, subunit K [Methanocella conradii HZ254]|uniref:DNA-directed RNA polymerase subunit Rpo6 n=2 Tax=Methanocella TaxID=570266 RepID=H8IB04_METCZ|nr:DNA-directed RNA polymerase subunit K [Methanocella conradii]AFD01014.1 DNA-directed RNA polymerase, subunit K [Methanocella conradii HZ254]MDI6897637.1 DNA-directed RNA polymerase subunit K [Methanocella conradii]